MNIDISHFRNFDIADVIKTADDARAIWTLVCK